MINDTLQKQLGSLLGIFLIVVTIFFAALTVSTIYKIHNPEPMQNVITVNGFGETSVEPNLAVINFGVRSTGDTTEEAQTKNSETTNELMEALKASGIEEKDLKTQNYSLYEDFTWNPQNGRQESQGWVVSQTLEIKTRDNEKVSEILALANRYGVTNVSGPNFQIDDASAYEADARERAIANARAQAERIAEQLGVRLGPVTSYSEWQDGNNQPYFGMGEMAMDRAGGAAPKIAPGQTEVGVTVSITYSLR